MAEKAKNVHEIIKKIEGEQWTKAIDKAFVKANKKAKIDGFRPGKAPRQIFEKKYGKESLYMDAVDIILQEIYSKVIEESKLEPVIQPKVDIRSIDDNSVELAFIITTMPEVELGKYKDLGIKKETVKVTKKEVEENLKELQEQYAEIVIKEGKAEKGDTVVIDFDGYLNGEAFEGGKSANYPLELGSNTFIPGFEDQLIGVVSGDERDVNVTFPEDYLEEKLKGKAVTFKVKVHEVKTKRLPELDEEFFLDLGVDDIKNKEDLLKNLEEVIKHEKTHEVENKYFEEVMEKISKNTKIDIPVEFIDAEVERLFSRFEQNISMQGITVDLYCKLAKTDIDSIKNQMRNEAERNVRCRMILEKIAEVEKIEVSDEEKEKAVEEMADRYQMTKEELINTLGGLDVIEYDVKMKKAIELITK